MTAVVRVPTLAGVVTSGGDTGTVAAAPSRITGNVGMRVCERILRAEAAMGHPAFPWI